MMFDIKTGCMLGLGLSLACIPAGGEDTLPPLKDGIAPATLEGTWAGFDPRREPLDVEVLKQWEEDGVVVKVIRFRVGIFKGKKAMMAAVYGYPKGAGDSNKLSVISHPGGSGGKLPGLVQIHGGGQSAQSSFVVKDARNGYATISIAWAGRINATHYKVTNKEKEAFWTGNTEDPDYMVTTDWGAVDGYHHHCRFKGNNFVQNPPSESTVDPVKSPRNSGWFLCTMGARRAITFLEQQPQVDKDRIGVYGMSMGGKLTVLTAGSDPRIKAAAPACGGISDLSTTGRTLAPVADDEYLRRITCPTIFMSPSCDFHSHVEDIPAAVKAIKNEEWRVVSSPNKNHGDKSEYAVGILLWFNQFLKGSFTMAATPKTKISLETADHTPVATVMPDAYREIVSANVYYTQEGERKPADRYWRLAKPVPQDGALIFRLPLVSTGKPLWAYADVQYALGRTVEGVGYSGEKVKTDTYHLASVVEMVGAEDLKAAGVVATIDESVFTENFDAYTPGSDLDAAFPVFTFNDGISGIADPGSRQGMSIQLQDSPDFEYNWQPLLTMLPKRVSFVDTSKWTFSTDVMLDAGNPAPLIVEVRKKHKRMFNPVIVDDKGHVSTRGKAAKPLCKVEPGSWWTFSVTYDLNHPQHYRVKISDAEGSVLAEEEIENEPNLGAVDWIGFIPHAKVAGRLYIDNVKLVEN